MTPRKNAQNGPWRRFSVKTCKHTAGTNGPQNGEYGARKENEAELTRSENNKAETFIFGRKDYKYTLHFVSDS